MRRHLRIEACCLGMMLWAASSWLIPSIVWAEPTRAMTASEIVLRVPTGKSINALGILTPQEANPEGPMSFTLAASGEILILDQVNARIQVFHDNHSVARVPLKFAENVSFSDLALLPDQRIVLLGQSYPLGEQHSALYLIDFQGTLHRKIDCPRPALGVQVVTSGQFAGVWADLGGEMMLLATLAGEPAPPRMLRGILSAKGDMLMHAEIIGPTTLLLHLASTETESAKKRLHRSVLDGVIIHVSVLGSDAQGKVYLEILLDEPIGMTAKKRLRHFVMVVDTDRGEEVRIPLFVQTSPHEMARPLRIQPDGQLYQLAVAGKEVILRKYVWQRESQSRPRATGGSGRNASG